MDRKQFSMLVERAAQFADRMLGRNVIFGVAMRRAKRVGYFAASSHDRARLRAEPVVEVSVSGTVIKLRPAVDELSESHHVGEIGGLCSGLWQVTNTYLTDILDRPISKPDGYLNTVSHFSCPIELECSGQQRELAWKILAARIGPAPILMSLNDFEDASVEAITSTMTPEGAKKYLFGRIW